MQTNHKMMFILSILALMLASLACKAAEQVAFGTPTPTITNTPTATATATATSLPLTATPTPLFEETCPNGDCIESCLNELGLELVNESPHSHRDPDFEGKSGQILVNYLVAGEELIPIEKKSVYSNFQSYQDDEELHQRIWDYYRAIIPTSYRKTITNFYIFTDGKQRILAYVAQSGLGPEDWILSVDVVDAETPQDLTYTLVHEFAHLLTLGPDQVIPSQEIFENPGDDAIWRSEYDACETYFPGEGCSVPDAYIDAFFTRFWEDIYREWLRIQYQTDQDDYVELLEDFYEIYQDSFVTDYAVTNPEEDIAESFTFFVLTARPDGNRVLDQKILFFYEYPELVSLRMDIIKGICGYNE